jgi:hypothetical protein
MRRRRADIDTDAGELDLVFFDDVAAGRSETTLHDSPIKQ